MFFATPLIGAAALLSGLTAALPRPDSAIGEEVAVSAPNGIIMSDTASQTATSQADTAASTWVASASTAQVSSDSSWTASSTLATATSTWASSSPPSYSSQVGSYSSQVWTTSAAPLATATSSTWTSSTQSYGSGSSSWGNQNYNSCVQQCVASFGSPSAATYTPPTATSYSGSSGSSGSGATHTVIVAPTQGVLRFVPFALNASVGDTIHFMWGANNHTVTKSSSLTPCNKTAEKPFGSGEQNKGFVFTQVVNDTSPTFFYCGTPTHCEKGMFGIINPPNALGSSTSASNMMQGLAMNNSDMAAYAAYANNLTQGSAAAGWGGAMDMSAMPDWAHAYAAENIMYTRTFLALNKDSMASDGSVNLTSAGSTPMMLPKDFSATLNSTGATSSATSSVSPSSSSVPSASSPGTSSASMASAAISTSSSNVLLGLVVGFATFMVL